MCIGLHTLPPCLLFCGNYILHESEYDVHIFCVALDIIIYLPPLDQARMLAVSHTKPLHDAVAQMADDLYGGYAPATPFSINKRFNDRLYFIFCIKQYFGLF